MSFTFTITIDPKSSVESLNQEVDRLARTLRDFLQNLGYDNIEVSGNYPCGEMGPFEASLITFRTLIN